MKDPGPVKSHDCPENTCLPHNDPRVGGLDGPGGGRAALDPRRPAPALVSRIKVLPDKAPDCSSLKAIVASVTRDCRSNDEKTIALYNFMQLTHYHLAYPGEPGGLPVLKEINCYGWSLCGGLHAEQSALWRELGWDWRGALDGASAEGRSKASKRW